MSVKLYLRGDIPGFPAEISSVFNSEEEALAQAVSDIKQGSRAWQPTRIEGEDGGVLMDAVAIQKAAA